MSSDLVPIGYASVKPTFQSKKQFPKDANGRSFQPNWVDISEWMEYSEECDAGFCYACRHEFGHRNRLKTESVYVVLVILVK